MSLAEEPSERLSQRQLRNESGRVLREVQEGRSFVVTNNGRPVAKLVPLNQPLPPLEIVRPARRKGGWSDLGIERKKSKESLQEILDDLRGDR